MPYYWGEGDPGWKEGNDEDEEYHPPKAALFRYLPPPELGGSPDPVSFSAQVPPRPVSPTPQAVPAAPSPSFLDRLLGRRPPPPPRLTWEEQQREAERRGQHALALFVAALREIGAQRLYCRYDGGNDEGFAWLDHVDLRSGVRLAADEAHARLADTQLLERLADAGLRHRRNGWARAQNVRDTVDIAIAPELAARLLGGGYGTGPFHMYGAFTVDLDACTIADDRNAGPAARHFTIEE